MECTLQVGDKVTPVDNFHWVIEAFWAEKPSTGVVYTVRSVDVWPGRGIGVRLVEIINGPGDDGREVAYNHEIFRRVIDTDISALQQTVREIFEKGKTPELVPTGAMR
jgi:hypothetical protein